MSDSANIVPTLSSEVSSIPETESKQEMVVLLDDGTIFPLSTEEPPY
ncbi:hypothetical protein [Heliorestis convoluta]|uniref:Uncharacterized protein n=1 Tax=Heliorestis convoluta TaxID=356322 RepID=A0A5Q2N5C7_9FIRM|nr:hypothetical protein [Heliorestis convoluta]QGG48522.1 hypothetical protein FTV88_2424 [Heliorestis convoluta]